MNYPEQQYKALQALLKNGVAVPCFRLASAANYDPIAGGVGVGQIEAQQEIVVISLIASKGNIKGSFEFDSVIQELLVRGELRYFIASAMQPDGSAQVFAPKSEDILFFNNAFFTLKGVNTLSPIGVDLLHKIGAVDGCQDFELSPGVLNTSLIA